MSSRDTDIEDGSRRRRLRHDGRCVMPADVKEPAHDIVVATNDHDRFAGNVAR